MRKTILLGCVAAAALGAPAFAQSAAAPGTATTPSSGEVTPPAARSPAPAPPGPAATVGVEEVVVTARRTSESLQRVPGAVSAFSSQQLDRIGATDATSLQGLVPNLNIVQGRGSADAANVFIRGLGQPDALQTFDPAVGVYLDDVYLSRIRGVLFNLFDLDRVEVLRGPQGTLYGRNTIGGAIRYITRRPGQDPRLEVSAAGGNYGQYEFKVSASGPVTPTLALGASLYASGHDDFVRDQNGRRGYNNQDNLAGRLQASWTPNDNFRVDLSADYTHESPHLVAGQQTANVYRINILPPARSGLGPVTVLYPGAQNGPGTWNYTAPISPGLADREPLNHAGFSAVETWRVSPDLTLKAISAYRHLGYDDSIDIDATPFQLGDVIVGVTQRQLSQELQANYEHGPIKAVAGFYFEREKVNSTQQAFGNDLYTLVGGPFPAVRLIKDDLRTNSYAGYLNVTYAFTPDLRLTGGLRYTDEQKTYYRTTTVNGAGAFTFDAHDSWSDVTPSASLDYQLRPNVLTYARFAEGFQSGGFNGRANSPGQQAPYNPETVYTYEIGTKTQWLDRRLTANLALFYNDYRDFQASVTRAFADPNPANPPDIVQSVVNAGKLHTYGAEVEAVYRPIPPLSLDAQFGYLQARYDRFTDLSYVTAANPTGDRSHQVPAFSPKYTARLGAAYEFDLAGYGLPAWAGYVSLGGGASFRSRMSLAVDDVSPTGQVYGNLFQGDYTLYDARLVWQDPTRKYTAGFYGKNIGGRIYKTDGQNFTAVAGIQTVYYGDPATFLFRVSAKFF